MLKQQPTSDVHQILHFVDDFNRSTNFFDVLGFLTPALHDSARCEGVCALTDARPTLTDMTTHPSPHSWPLLPISALSA